MNSVNCIVSYERRNQMSECFFTDVAPVLPSIDNFNSNNEKLMNVLRSFLLLSSYHSFRTFLLICFAQILFSEIKQR